MRESSPSREIPFFQRNLLPYIESSVLAEEVQSCHWKSSPFWRSPVPAQGVQSSRGIHFLTEELSVLAEGVQSFQRKSSPYGRSLVLAQGVQSSRGIYFLMRSSQSLLRESSPSRGIAALTEGVESFQRKSNPGRKISVFPWKSISYWVASLVLLSVSIFYVASSMFYSQSQELVRRSHS